ncbi:fused response regulator/phosphatase [Nocardioides sp. GY 10113]|uniref:PP2C family protein-serine/threonine phosphatase n=1 Tax=Nocardioides sp. GY 10113 TaxID=2569761 RepID=UPI001F0F2EE1|nr:fused response regulator/phosphatase [Nocardioides sp. GY 10113]
MLSDNATDVGERADRVDARVESSPRSPGPEPEPVVLLVEDDPGDALLVEELVADSRPGMDLRWVRSMADAVAWLQTERADCVLLDLHLPDAHGLDALAALRERADDVAVVVLTGLAGEATGLAAVAAGAQDYLVKGGVDAEWLGRAVRYAVQRKQTEQAAVALQASHLQARENARLERGLLPTPMLRQSGGLEVVNRYHPGRAQALLGGDFYDVVQAPDGSAEVLIGDVSGHGPDEAALGVALRIAWRTLVLSGVEGSERLRRLDQLLDAERPQEHIFATLTSLSLAADRRRVEVMRAGHPGMMVRTGNRVEWLEVPGGPALGILPDAEWPRHELLLPEGDWGLVLFTDGLFEGRTDTHGARLGEEGLLAEAQRLGAAAPDVFVDTLIGRAQDLAEEFGGIDDDVAVVHVRWQENA